MKISSRAWHLRLSRSLGRGDYEPHNLCSYFWHVVWSLLVWFLLLVYLPAGIISGAYLVVSNFPIQSALAVGSATLLAVIIFTTVKIVAWSRRQPEKPKRSARQPKEPGLIRSYIKARKERYCPLIEVVED